MDVKKLKMCPVCNIGFMISHKIYNEKLYDVYQCSNEDCKVKIPVSKEL